MHQAHALTFLEEIMLLALDDQTGALRSMPIMACNYALAGALIADLALASRIDTDLEHLILLDASPTGDALLDDALALIAAGPANHPVSEWLEVFAEKSEALQEVALARLIQRGILKREDKKFLWVFGLRRYPTIDNEERTEVRTRLSALILGDDLPDPRDAVLISLLVACHLAPDIFDNPAIHEKTERLALLAKMDLVGREVAQAIEKINRALNLVSVRGAWM